MAEETSNPSTETLGVTSRESVTLPDSVDGNQAADLWQNLGFNEGETPPNDPNQEEDTADRPAEGLDLDERADSDEQPDEGEPESDEQEPQEEVELPELAEAPEFWSEEDRKHWLTAPPALRDTIKRYEKQRIDAVNEKTREAAEKVKTAETGAKQLLDLVQGSAQWWQQNGQALQQAMQGKWAGVDWKDLAENNPAEFTRLKFLKDQDDALLNQTRAQGERDTHISQQRQQAEIADKKRSAHEVMAKEMPDHFGPGKYEETYTKLGKFLVEQGIPAERVNAIHEAPIIRMAMESMLYRESKAKASVVATTTRDPSTGKFTAKVTPTRVKPGPGTIPGNRQAELDRQAMKQLRDSRGTDESAALRIFNNLR